MKVMLANLCRGALLAGSSIAIGLLGACASDKPPAASTEIASSASTEKIAAAALEAEFGWSLKSGGNTVNGLVAYHPQKAQRWTCALQAVALMPDAATSRARVMALYGSVDLTVKPVSEVRQKSAAAGEPTFSAFVKQTACDANDRFTFENAADGSYFLVARARRANAKADEDGVVIVQHVTLAGGKAISVRVPAF